MLPPGSQLPLAPLCLLTRPLLFAIKRPVGRRRFLKVAEAVKVLSWNPDSLTFQDE